MTGRGVRGRLERLETLCRSTAPPSGARERLKEKLDRMAAAGRVDLPRDEAEAAEARAALDLYFERRRGEGGS